MSFWNDKEAKKLFQKLLIYNVLTKKTKIRGLKNRLLHKLPFYDELNIYKMSKGFGWHARSYEVQITDSKYPCGEIAIEMKKCFRLKDMFIFNVL